MTEAPAPAGPGRPAWLLLAGLLVSALLGFTQHEANQRHLRQAFEALARDTVAQLASRMQTYEYGLRGARGAVVTAGVRHVSRSDFARYHATRDLAREFPGAHGFGFIRRIAPQELEGLIARHRLEGFTDFRVQTLTPHPGAHYVIEYIEPLAPNRPAVGLDIASEAHRREAAEQAARSGLARLTAPITLLQASGQPGRGFLLLLPVYRDGAPTDTEAARWAATEGWAYAPLVFDRVAEDMLAARPLLALSLHDRAEGPDSLPIYRSAGLDAARATGLVTVQEQQVFGRLWVFELRAQPGFVEAQGLTSPWAVFAASLVTAWLLAAVVQLRRQDRQRALQVRQNQARLAAMAANSSDAIVGTQLDGQVTSWNRAAEQIFGWPAGEAIGQPLDALIGRDLPADARPDGWAQVAAGHAQAPFDTERRRRDGSLVEVSLAAAPITDSTGQVVGIGLSLRDIGARRALERQRQALASTLEQQVAERTAQLEAARHDLQTILDALPSQVAYWDRSLVNRFANSACHRWHDRPPGRLPGSRMPELLGTAGWAAVAPSVTAVLAGQPQTFSGTVVSPGDGAAHHLLTHLFPDTVDGRTRGFYMLVHDVTELTDSQRRLGAAEAANAAKTAFLANISHEMRTPLNAVIGFTHVLARSPLQPAQQRAVQRVQSAARALLDVINDVLDLSKIEAGQMTLVSEPFRTDGLLEALRDLTAPLAEAKRLGLRIERDHAVPDVLVGDGLRVRQMLTNLLANAIKFTEQGEVTLRLSLVDPPVAPAHGAQVAGERTATTPTGDRPEAGAGATADGAAQGGSPPAPPGPPALPRPLRLRCEVEDTGIGIAPDVQARLFQPFTQADASTTRRFGGTGLGLSIVRRLAELMGGTVGLRSRLGEGSLFWVELPLAEAAPEAPPADHEPGPLAAAPGALRLPDVHVLVVDDSALNREVAASVLGEEGARVTLADSAQAALARLRDGPDDIDLVLMDLQMPDLDGPAATRRLRALPAAAQLPVLALSAAALGPARDTALAAGMDDFVTKPIAPDALVAAIRRQLAARGRAPMPRPRPAGPAPAAPVWPAPPALPGVDLAGALARPGHDPALLARQLDRLVDEFRAEFAPEATAARLADGGDRLARQLHKLRGSAGAAAAEGVVALATAAEQAWHSRPPGPGAAVTPALTTALAALHCALGELASRAPLWRAWAAEAAALGASGLAPAGPAEPAAGQGAALAEAPEQAFAHWQRQLAERDLAAVAGLAPLRPWLAGRLAPERLAALQQAVARLDFAAAERLLAEDGQSPGRAATITA